MLFMVKKIMIFNKIEEVSNVQLMGFDFSVLYNEFQCVIFN